jgi:hypothetical protein
MVESLNFFVKLALLIMSSEKGYKKTVHNFYERQSRVKSWGYYAFVGILGFLLVFLAFKFTEHKPFVPNNFAYWPHACLTFLIFCFWFYFYHLTSLTTAINEQGVFVKWSPFSKKFTMMLWEDIREIRLVMNNGITGEKKYSQKFSVGTPSGIEIMSRSGRKKYISTRKIESLPRILARMAPEKFRSTGVGELNDLRED